ncbi:Uma2 family endonuclease [Pyxidicoccus fallax]|uniref:Uma2 family endonuclease n=1 Tax=Pyxidicoccus fallax TaxID=394095 RepID=A0A848LNR3_9BACT|nr:Uma2 family endonuclease [Pyxidicoccus fallax]NMO19505.1 Uma2 family endonuclease [Pyxidicoccus fallax]NPC79931.1 Uma2 family endonuclease [Pyxidicoccus fallax]
MGRHAKERGEAFPRAPTQAEWDAMGPEERARVVESLPDEVTDAELAMPEGDLHFAAKVETRDALLGYFARQKRDVYIGSELPIYYPGERRFAPDLLVVLDVPSHKRGKWVVSHEGKGLDWVMEVHVGGDRKKDAEFNVKRYARLGIPEYFIFDRSREELLGYRLETPGDREYTRMKPRRGRFYSEVLGLELAVEDDKLRMWAGQELLLESTELLEIERRRAEELEARLKIESRLRRDEARRRKELEQRLAELQAQLAQRRPH